MAVRVWGGTQCLVLTWTGASRFDKRGRAEGADAAHVRLQLVPPRSFRLGARPAPAEVSGLLCHAEAAACGVRGPAHLPCTQPRGRSDPGEAGKRDRCPGSEGRLGGTAGRVGRFPGSCFSVSLRHENRMPGVGAVTALPPFCLNGSPDTCRTDSAWRDAA